MKVDKIITSKEDINIVEARLLTKEEAEALPERLRLYDNWWWTFKADADDHNEAVVMCDIRCYSLDYSADLEYAVRPALVFESKDLKVGDKFYFGSKGFEVIKEGLAFCTSDIGECAFRTDWRAEDANDYEKSDIKKYVEDWFEENVR